MTVAEKSCAACGVSGRVDLVEAFGERPVEACAACGHVAPDVSVAYPALAIATEVRRELLALPGHSARALRCLAVANLFTDADLEQEGAWALRAARLDRDAGNADAALPIERRAAACLRGVVREGARTADEMRFFASLAPCVVCEAVSPDAHFDLFGAGTRYLLAGRCPECRSPRTIAFATEGDPNQAPHAPGELGDARPSKIVSAEALRRELERLAPLAADEAPRERALLCVRELLKFDRADTAWLAAQRERLLASGLTARAQPLDRIVRVLFDEAGPPPTVGALEQALGLTLLDAHATANAGGRLVLSGDLGPDVTDVSATYVVRRPITTLGELRARPLERWSIALRAGWIPVELRLRERFGSPREEGGVHVYGTWTVTPAGQACTVAYVEPPRA